MASPKRAGSAVSATTSSLQEACRAGLGAQGILDQLFARLDRFVGENRQLEDDASMVVFRLREDVMLPPLHGRNGDSRVSS
jgi:hypothetical protein